MDKLVSVLFFRFKTGDSHTKSGKKVDTLARQLDNNICVMVK